MPETVFQKLKKNILPQWKVCFFAAMIVGLVAHFYKITNWLPNWDSIVFRYDNQNMIALGRWFLPVVCSFSSFYDLPFLNGILSLIFHGIAAVIICRILDVKKNITAFLIGAVVVSFPTVTSVMMYNYVADGYAFAFLLACIAANCMTEEKPKYAMAAVLIALSAGIYQAYITVAILLLMFWLIKELVFENKDISGIIKKSIFCAITGVAGLGLYYIILNIILHIFGTELLEYQGLDSAVSFKGINLYASLYYLKETFLSFFFDFSNGVNLFNVLNISIFIVMTVIYLVCALRNKVFASAGKIILLVLFLTFLMVGGTVLVFINASVDYHNLMLMGYCMYYLMFIDLYERGIDEGIGVVVVKNWVVLIISVILILNQITIANVSYHKAQMAYEKSYGTLIRIADRIEQTQGADVCDEILIIGALEDSKDYSVNFPPEMTGITDGFIIRADDESVGQSVFTSAINDYCHKNYKFLSGERKKAFLSKEEVENMSSWPLKGSIAVIEDVIVIKLGAESVA